MSSQPPAVKSLALKHIRVDESIQPRADGLHEPTVREYAAEMEGGTEFPPVVVYHANGVNWLSEGFHRVAAAESIRQAHVMAEIRPGGRLEALINAAGSNRHGLKRTNKDKRRAVMMLLTECPDWSDRRIADACGVSQPFVSGVRPKQTLSTQSVITVITPEVVQEMESETLHDTKSNPVSDSEATDEQPDDSGDDASDVPDTADPPGEPVGGVADDLPPLRSDPAFKDAGLFVAALEALRATRRVFTELSQSPAGFFLLKFSDETGVGWFVRREFTANDRKFRNTFVGFDGLARALKACVPHVPECSKCRGAGCGFCSDQGWLPKAPDPQARREAMSAGIDPWEGEE